MANPIYPGTIRRVFTYSGTVGAPVGGFRDVNGALADPTLVRLLWNRHGEAQTIWLVAAGQVVKDAVGLYHADIPITEPGLHYYRWETGPTGPVITAIEDYFSVESYFVAGAP